MFNFIIYVLSLFHPIIKYLFAEPPRPTIFREICDISIFTNSGERRGIDGEIPEDDLYYATQTDNTPFITLADIMKKSKFNPDTDDYMRITFSETPGKFRHIIFSKLPPSLFARETFFNIPIPFAIAPRELIPRELVLEDHESNFVSLEEYMCDDSNFAIHGDTFRCKHIFDEGDIKVVKVDGTTTTLDANTSIDLEEI